MAKFTTRRKARPNALKVVLWNTSYLKAVGGAEKVVHDLAHEFDARGLKTFVIADKPRQPSVRSTAFSSLGPTVEVYADDFRYPFSRSPNPFAILADSVRYLGSVARLFSYFRRNRFDIIHLHYINFDVFVLIVFRLLFRCRLVLTFTGGDVALAENNRLGRLRIAFALRSADASTVVSRDMAQRLERLFARPVRVIPNGVRVERDDLAIFEGLSQVKAGHFVYCGRLTLVKRVEFLVRSFQQCVIGGCTKDLYIVGAGECAESLRVLIEELGLKDRVFLMGGLAHAEALEVVRRSLCLVLVSASEGLPVAILEAMALGKPVISSRVGGVPEVVADGVNGWLFPPDRPDRLCQLLMDLSVNEREALRAGEGAARTIAERFSLERMGQDYLNLYEGLLE
jgi:glycosyltransferase involved in cell wall biosynthesis